MLEADEAKMIANGAMKRGPYRKEQIQLIRRLFDSAAAVSLAFCLATGGLWLVLAVRGGVSKLSHRPNDVVSIRSCVSGHEGEFEYSSFHDPSGRVIQYMTTENPADFERTVRITGRSFEFPGITVMWGRVDLRGADRWGPFHVRIVRVEYIEIIILALILPFLWMSRRIVKRVLRHRRDVCHRCGYNLTGNTSGVCP